VPTRDKSGEELAEMYLQTNVIFQTDDLFEPFTVLSTLHSLPDVQRMKFTGLTNFLKRFWVITSDNPLSEKKTLKQNAPFRQLLELDLQSFGIRYEPVECISHDGTWRESSYAVSRQPGLKDEQIQNCLLALAGKYGQNAIFSFSGNKMKVIPALRPEIIGEKSYFIHGPIGG
jgi:hypothetical protein